MNLSTSQRDMGSGVLGTREW